MANYLKKLRKKLFPFEQGENGDNSGVGELNPGDTLFDINREVAALKEIRDAEARQFGPVDASTHRDFHQLVSATEGLAAAQGAMAHPLLDNQAYFSGVDEIRNNPVLSNNTEAELRYKEYQLEFQKQLQAKLTQNLAQQSTPTMRRG